MNLSVTGSGIVSAIGLCKSDVLSSLVSRQTGISVMRRLPSVHHDYPVAEVRLSNDELKQILHIPVEREISRTVLLGLKAVREALEEARVDMTTFRKKRVVLVSGTTVGGMDITEEHFARLDTDRNGDFLRFHDCGSGTRQIADSVGGFSEYTTISTACSSAANAIIVGAEMIRSGEADIVVAGGTESLSVFHLNGFRALMILDKEKCRPFDACRAGLNLGEGAAYVVMESEQSARERGVDIHAYLAGYGNACDAFHQTASSPDGEGAYRAMGDALRMAGLLPEQIQYVNAHGTGTPNNDLSETVALQRIFGSRMPRISSTKSFTGHTTSASGSVEAVICLLAMQHGFVPANLGWEHPMENGIVPSAGEENVVLKYVMSNSFGFGGNDSSLIFSARPVEAMSEDDSGKASGLSLRMAACVEVSSEEELDEIRQYVKPLEARRMGTLMKASLLTSLKALEQAGIETPDAIVIGTAYGCLDYSEKILFQLVNDGEQTVSPTLFMQSTHNTISGNIAVRTHCHGYNITYTQGRQSLDWAMRDARRLLSTGQCRSVLVGYHDESTPLFRELMPRIDGEEVKPLRSLSMVWVAE